MMEMMQLLTITTDAMKIGVDSTEVERALLDSARTDTGMVETAKNEKRLVRLESLLNLGTPGKEESFLIVAAGEGKKLLVAFTGTVDFTKVRLSSILAVPAYIRKKQNPLFVWGFVPEKDRFITLVTFGFFAPGDSG
jgi:hypothetical protein